jgi:hypothetical protein
MKMKRGSLFSLAVTQVALVACQSAPPLARDPSATAVTTEVVPLPTPTATDSSATNEAATVTSATVPSTSALAAAPPPAADVTPASTTTTTPPRRPRTTPDGRPAPGNVASRSSRRE